LHASNRTGNAVMRTRGPKSRKEKRYEIWCPVTIHMRSAEHSGERQSGKLIDISPKGARFYSQPPLPLGSEIRLSVHFARPWGGVTTLVFEGAVTRVGDSDPCEVVACFRRHGRFLRHGIRDFIASRQTNLDQKRQHRLVKAESGRRHCM